MKKIELKETLYFYPEYVENYVLSDKVQNLKGNNREQKWKIFFDEEPAGRQIKACILKQNPAWTKEQAAAEISGIYRFISLGAHSSPNEMYDISA